MKEADSYDRSWIKKAEAGHRERMQGLQKSRTVSSVGFGFVHHLRTKTHSFLAPVFLKNGTKTFSFRRENFLFAAPKTKNLCAMFFGVANGKIFVWRVLRRIDTRRG
ncbi:hypothetical protein HMPREF1989_02232 [Porphyromonas gingivalis F0566]|nr:hypothetical protein HMPREF1989_02232 [Porphyromonas gingivalis F0566]